MYIYTRPYVELGPYNYILGLDFPAVKELKEIITAKYKVRVKYLQGNNNSMIFLNGHRLVWRPNKFKPIIVENCVIVEGTPLPMGGSNVHPYATFKEGYCVIEAECDGFPDLEKSPFIEVLSIERI